MWLYLSKHLCPHPFSNYFFVPLEIAIVIYQHATYRHLIHNGIFVAGDCRRDNKHAWYMEMPRVYLGFITRVDPTNISVFCHTWRCPAPLFINDTIFVRRLDVNRLFVDQLFQADNKDLHCSPWAGDPSIKNSSVEYGSYHDVIVTKSIYNVCHLGNFFSNDSVLYVCENSSIFYLNNGDDQNLRN